MRRVHIWMMSFFKKNIRICIIFPFKPNPCCLPVWIPEPANGFCIVKITTLILAHIDFIPLRAEITLPFCLSSFLFHVFHGISILALFSHFISLSPSLSLSLPFSLYPFSGVIALIVNSAAN